MSPHRRRLAEVVRERPVDLVEALVLLAAEAGRDPDAGPVRARLDRLAEDARPLLATGTGAAEALARSLGDRAGFRGADTAYDDPASSYLPDVLRRRSGLPVLLSVVWVEVARRLGVRARCLDLPGHVLAEVDGTVVDPFAGGRTRDLLADGAPTLADGPLLLRVLANLRALAGRTGDTATALWATECSLLLPDHPLDLRRERGRLLVLRGRHLDGARELEAYAEVAPAPAADQARRAAAMARARLN